MKRAKKAAVALAVGTAMCAVLGTAQAEGEVYVSTCQYLDGFSGGLLGSGAAAVVQANSAFFLSNNKVKKPDYCQIMYPESSGKGKPSKNWMTIPPEEGKDMTQDECSMYRYLASIDSKLAMAKVGDAYVVVSDMINKVNMLYGAGQLEQTGYEAIYKILAVGGPKEALQPCITQLMSQ